MVYCVVCRAVILITAYEGFPILILAWHSPVSLYFVSGQKQMCWCVQFHNPI